jgi:hypothetical protein
MFYSSTILSQWGTIELDLPVPLSYWALGLLNINQTLLDISTCVDISSLLLGRTKPYNDDLGYESSVSLKNPTPSRASPVRKRVWAQKETKVKNYKS